MVVELVLGSPARGIHHGRDAVKGEKKARRDRPSAVAAVAGLVRPSSGGWWWLWRRVVVALCGRALVKNDAESV